MITTSHRYCPSDGACAVITDHYHNTVAEMTSEKRWAITAYEALCQSGHKEFEVPADAIVDTAHMLAHDAGVHLDSQRLHQAAEDLI